MLGGGGGSAKVPHRRKPMAHHRGQDDDTRGSAGGPLAGMLLHGTRLLSNLMTAMGRKRSYATYGRNGWNADVNPPK